MIKHKTIIREPGNQYTLIKAKKIMTINFLLCGEQYTEKQSINGFRNVSYVPPKMFFLI